MKQHYSSNYIPSFEHESFIEFLARSTLHSTGFPSNSSKVQAARLNAVAIFWSSICVDQILTAVSLESCNINWPVFAGPSCMLKWIYIKTLADSSCHIKMADGVLLVVHRLHSYANLHTQTRNESLSRWKVALPASCLEVPQLHLATTLDRTSGFKHRRS